MALITFEMQPDKIDAQVQRIKQTSIQLGLEVAVWRHSHTEIRVACSDEDMSTLFTKVGTTYEN